MYLSKPIGRATLQEIPKQTVDSGVSLHSSVVINVNFGGVLGVFCVAGLARCESVIAMHLNTILEN